MATNGSHSTEREQLITIQWFSFHYPTVFKVTFFYAFTYFGVYNYTVFAVSAYEGIPKTVLHFKYALSMPPTEQYFNGIIPVEQFKSFCSSS